MGMGMQQSMYQKNQEVVHGTRIADPFNAIMNHTQTICCRDKNPGILKTTDIEQFVGQWRALRFQIADYAEQVQTGKLTLAAYANLVEQMQAGW